MPKQDEEEGLQGFETRDSIFKQNIAFFLQVTLEK